MLSGLFGSVFVQFPFRERQLRRPVTRATAGCRTFGSISCLTRQQLITHSSATGHQLFTLQQQKILYIQRVYCPMKLRCEEVKNCLAFWLNLVILFSIVYVFIDWVSFPGSRHKSKEVSMPRRFIRVGCFYKVISLSIDNFNYVAYNECRIYKAE